MLKKIFTIFFSLSFVLLSINLCYGQSNTHNYKKNKTISLNEFLYSKDAPDNWKQLKLNKNGDVIYKKKVIINEKGQPINNDTASDSYFLLKILLIASGAQPRAGCDTSDTYKNGIYGLGCYTYESDE